MRTARRQLEILARDPVLFALVLIIMAAIGTFVVYPLINVLLASFQIRGDWSTANYELLATRRIYRAALVNSLTVASFVGVIGTALGFVVAFVLTRTNVPFKRALHLLTLLPIISPPFVGAISILFLFGFNGLVTKQLLQLQDFNIYGRWGVIFSQIFTFAPLAYLSLRGVLQSINPTLEDAAFNIGASKWQAFWKVTFPLALPGIFSAFLVVFIESISDFGNPLVLAGAAFPMLAPQAYLEITGSFNLGRGATLATILLLPSMTAFAIQRYWVSKRQYVTVTGKPTSSTSKIVTPFAKWLL
nr:ABC transporter permease subunit [Deinococcota bacterium]